MKKLVLIAASAFALAVGTAAYAQTPNYSGQNPPPGTAPTSAQQNDGTLGPSGDADLTSCLFQPGTNVSETLNGANAGTDNVESNGCASAHVHVVSTSALGRPVVAALGAVRLAQSSGTAVITIDGQQFNARVGSNTYVVTGTGANGQPRTVTHTFTIASEAGRGLARTGTAIIAWTVAGLALLGAGVLLATADRRRRTASD